MPPESWNEVIFTLGFQMNTLQILRITIHENKAKYLSHNVIAQSFRATDTRNIMPMELLRQNLITRSAHDTIVNGRKWHKELPSTSAIGLSITVKRALRTSPTQPLFLVEEDAECSHNLRDEIQNAMKMFSKGIDLIVFGSDVRGSINTSDPEFLAPGGMDFYFFKTHSVLYSPGIRGKISDALDLPQEVQYDALLGLMAKQGEINIRFRPGVCVQKIHWSSIQKICLLCALNNKAILWIVVCSILFVILFLIGLLKKRPDPIPSYVPAKFHRRSASY